jgi:glycosyltransferase involved in cell wall biosynthesis
MLTVAVVIPTIPGREDRLGRAIESVMDQTRHPDQIIVQEDTQHLGAAVTRNRGLERVECDLVAWLDDDDLLLPNHIERLARVLERSARIDLVYPIPRVEGGRDPTAVAVDGNWVKPWRVPFGPEQETHLREQGSFIPITHMVRTEKVRDIGGFPLPGTTRWIEDWGYLVNLLDAGATFYHLPVTTWRWQIHDQMTGGGSQTPGRPLWDREH